MPYSYSLPCTCWHLWERKGKLTHIESFSCAGPCAHKLFYLILVGTLWGRWIYTSFYSCPSDTNLLKAQRLLEEKLWFAFQWIRVCLILNLFFPLPYSVLHKYHLCHHYNRHPYGPSENSSCSQQHFARGFIILILKMRKWRLGEFKWSAQVHAAPERHN